MTWLSKDTRRPLIIILAFYAIVSFIKLGEWGVIESSEARYAEISREMISNEDWLHPTLLGIHHYHKPPVTYWLTTTGYALFGINPFGARALLVVSYLLQIFFVYKISHSILRDEKISLYSSIIYSSFPIVLTSVRGLTADAYLNTFILAAIASWCNWRRSSKFLWLYLVAALLGLAFLTKGPVALLVPAMVFIGLNKSLDSPSPAHRVHYVAAPLIFVIVAGSWFALLIKENESIVDYFLFRHTIDRFVQAGVFSRSQPWWYYLAYTPLLALPWTIILLYHFRSGWQNQIPAGIKNISIFWILIPLAFFSASSSKLILYVLPVFGGLAIVCGWCVRVMKASSITSLERVFFGWAVSIGLILLSLSFFPEYNSSSTIIAVTLVYLLCLGIIKYRPLLSTTSKVLAYSLSMSGYLILFSSLFISINEVKFNSTKPIAVWISNSGLKDHQVIIYDQLLPSLAFALQKEIISINDGNRNLDREVQFEDNTSWKKSLINLKESSEGSLDTLLARPTIVIVKGQLEPGNPLLTRGCLSMKKDFGKWKVYCNSNSPTSSESDSHKITKTTLP